MLPALFATSTSVCIPSVAPTKDESTIIQSITQAGVRLINCFLSYNEKQKSPHDVLLQHPKKVHQVLIELKEAHAHNNPNVLQLATKINDIAKSFWEEYQKAEKTTPEVEQALLAVKLLAKNLKEADQTSEEIWKHLNQEVQQLFNKTVYLQEEPKADCLKLRWCHSTVSLPESPITVSFEDNAVFCLKKETAFNGLTSYSMPSHPSLRLYHTGSLPNITQPKIQNILQNIPLRLSEIFDIEPVIQKFNLHRPINELIANKFLHQIVTMRNSYLNMILEALGVDVLRPKAIGAMGEWTIFSKDTSHNRSLMEIKDWSTEAELLNSAAEAITRLLTLEQSLGLKLIVMPEEGAETNSFMQNMFKVIGKHAVPGVTLEKIDFIEPNSHKRLLYFKSFFEKYFAPEVVQKVDWDKIFTTWSSDASCEFLRKLITIKILSPEDLKPNSPKLIALLQTNQNAFLKNPILYRQIPWDKFKDEESLRLYLQLVSIASPEIAQPEILLEHSYCLAKKLILEMPKHEIGTTCVEVAPKIDYEKVVNQFLGDKSTLYKFIVSFILSTYQKTENISFKEHLTETLESELEDPKQKSIYKALCKRLNEEGITKSSLNPANWILSISEKPCSPGDYFGFIFWQECIDKLLTTLNVSYTPKIEDNLAISRTAFLCANSASEKAAAYKQLGDVIHDHMSIAETKRQVNELKEQLGRSLR